MISKEAVYFNTCIGGKQSSATYEEGRKTGNDMRLYKWQKECLDKWINSSCRGIVQAVTGSGKTVLALAAIKELLKKYPDLKVKIVVPTIPLANQWEKSIRINDEGAELETGFFGGGIHDDPGLKVMIYVINSARQYLPGHVRKDLALSEHVLLICDECHHYQSRENSRIFSFLTKSVIESGQYFSLGISATPLGNERDAILIRGLGRVICRYHVDAALKDEIISPFVIGEVAASFKDYEYVQYLELSDRISVLMARVFECHKNLRGLSKPAFLKAISKIAKEARMDSSEPCAALLLLLYKRKDLCNLSVARAKCAIALIDQLRYDDRIIIFCEQIRQAEELAVFMKRIYGNICAPYHSKMIREARQRVLREFEDHRIRILVSCKCLDEGIDVPDANTGIIMSSTSVERQRLQRLGRIIRRADGKSQACLYYIYIKESSDDRVYLREIREYDSFSLRYYTEENIFSNPIYEYAAGTLLNRFRDKGAGGRELSELRRCIAEGLARSDYLLEPGRQNLCREHADGLHQKNYWNTMIKIGNIINERTN